MYIQYGDYKDLNFVSSYNDQSASEEEKELWKMFVEGKLSLKEVPIKKEEYTDYAKIFVRHNVFEYNEYTSYTMIRENKNSDPEYINICKSYDRRFIDRAKRVIVCEKTDSQTAFIPSSLNDVKRREIEWHESRLRRFLNDVKLYEEEGILKAMNLVIESEKNDIIRWKNKRETRWFY